MGKYYETPEMEIMEFNAMNILTTSPLEKTVDTQNPNEEDEEIIT